LNGEICAALDCEKACGAVLGVGDEPGAGWERRGGGGKGDIIRVGGSPARGNAETRAAAPGAAFGGAGVKPAALALAWCAAALAGPLSAAAASSCAVGAGFATHVSKSLSSEVWMATDGAIPLSG
jgi:hypothetical protein